MEMPPEIERLYNRYQNCNMGLGRPVLNCPVAPSDIELVFEDTQVVLNIARCPRVFTRRVSVSFLNHNVHYLLDAVHLLQLVGGAGQVWRRIFSQPDRAQHWRPVICYSSFREGFVGRPWDWPDSYLPLPDPVYSLPPGSDEIAYACLTPLVSF